MAQRSAAMRLFADGCESPVIPMTLESPAWKDSDLEHWKDSDLEQVITPFGKSCTFGAGSNFTMFRKMGENCVIKKCNDFLLIDEDSGLGMEHETDNDAFQLSAISSFLETENSSRLNDSFTEISVPRTPFALRRRSSLAKKQLFSNKRSAELPETDDIVTSTKKIRHEDNTLLKSVLTNCTVQQEPEPDLQSIIRAVDRLTTEVDLVADGSRGYSLPTITGKHGDLKTISCHTMADVLSRSEINNRNVFVVDCRYPYEYNGGHIKGAVNMYTKDEVHTLLQLTEAERPKILVFHCEFSSERGPKMYRFLRSCDRELNKECYPRLNFPEVYVLEGGYKEFYTHYPNLCDPSEYKPMLHKDHTSDLRHFRVKSKSWTGGQQGKQLSKSRLSRSCLSLKY